MGNYKNNKVVVRRPIGAHGCNVFFSCTMREELILFFFCDLAAGAFLGAPRVQFEH